MPKYVQDKQGNVYEDLGKGLGRQLSQEEIDAAGQSPLETGLKSAAVSAAQAWEGVKSLAGSKEAKSNLDQAARLQEAYGNVNPISNVIGQAAPAVGVGLATMGAGVLPTMAVEGAMGAAYSPDNPLMGAGIGAALGGLPFGAVAAGRAIKAGAPELMGRIGANLQDPFVSGIAPTAGGRGIRGRVLGAIDAAAPDAPPGQFYKGLMKSEEIPPELMTPAMRVALDAPDAATADYAKKMLWKEGLQGVGEQEKRSQRMYMTNLVKNEMGVTEDVALTDTVIGDVLKQEGGNIGRILKTSTDLNIPLSTLDDMKGVVDSAETGWQGSLGNVVKNIEKNIEQNGALTPQGYQNAITKLNEIGAPGRSAGAIQDAKKLRDALSGQVEGSLSKAEKQLLAEARYRYKIAKTLKQGAGVGSDMMVNAKSFGSNWDRKLAQTARGRDTIGKAADTMNFLSTMEANAGTTLQRNIAQLPGAIQQAAPTAIATSLGIPAVGAGYNYLFGQ